ncbi:MAG: RNA-binding protein [Ghiorsea sp.]
MSMGCVVKGIVIAGVLGLVGYFAAPMVGLSSAVPVGSLVAIGLFVGYLVGAYITWRASSSCSAGKSTPSNTNVLYVGNIPFKAREEEVQRLFETYGGVKSVRLVRGGPSRRPKGYGFVEMASAKDVKAALVLNGEEFAGRKLRVNEAKDKK